MRKFLFIGLFFVLICQEMNARDILVAEFLEDYIGVILGKGDYAILNYWEGKGSQDIQVNDQSGKAGIQVRKTYNIKDVNSFNESIIKLSYSVVNAEIEQVTLETEFDLGDTLLDEFVRVGGTYDPRTEDEGNIAFSGTYRFDDYIITVTEYKREEKLSFNISMTSQFKNKNIRRR